MGCVRSCVLGGAMVISGVAVAGLHQGGGTPPGGFVQAASYLVTGSGGTPGQDLATEFGTPADFHEMAFAGNGSTQVSAAASGGAINNSASAQAALGYIGLFSYDSSPSQSPGPLGVGHGGFKEQ